MGQQCRHSIFPCYSLYFRGDFIKGSSRGTRGLFRRFRALRRRRLVRTLRRRRLFRALRGGALDNAKDQRF